MNITGDRLSNTGISNVTKIWDVAVIGGGPAGMMAAGRAAELGAQVVLLEKNPTLGKKLLITGGGRCNVTNAQYDTRELLENYKEYGKFLFSAFSQWAVRDTLNFFNGRGMITKVENENRVFPASDSAQSVHDVLVEYMKAGNVTVMTNCQVAEIRCSEIGLVPRSGTSGKMISSILTADGKEIFAKSFILATGGKSYPETGSTGDGFVWLKKLGHNIIKPDSALVPVNIKDAWVRNLQGVTLPDIKIALFQDGKKIEVKRGKILFTHFGVSGPTILNMSRKINELLPYGDVFISLDLFPDHDFSSLNEALQQLFRDTENNRKFKNAMPSIIPSALVEIVSTQAEIDQEKFCHSITREERVRLMHVLKGLKMQVQSLMSPENAIVPSGGVDVTEVDFKTMRSKLISNLYVTGDILNINRPSGGFSLQLCWTTGFVAGTGAVNG